MKKTIITLLLFIPVFLFAQGSTAQGKAKSSDLTVTEKMEKYRGIFQIQMKDNRLKALLPYNIDVLIEQNRSETIVTYVSLGTDVRLMILPKSAARNKQLALYSTF